MRQSHKQPSRDASERATDNSSGPLTRRARRRFLIRSRSGMPLLERHSPGEAAFSANAQVNELAENLVDTRKFASARLQSANTAGKLTQRVITSVATTPRSPAGGGTSARSSPLAKPAAPRSVVRRANGLSLRRAPGRGVTPAGVLMKAFRQMVSRSRGIAASGVAVAERGPASAPGRSLQDRRPLVGRTAGQHVIQDRTHAMDIGRAVISMRGLLICSGAM